MGEEMAVKVYLEEAGCDRRRLDAESIRGYLRTNGYELVDDPRKADRIVAVVCAFKAKEEDESVRRLRSLRAYGRDILVYGCLADIAADRYTEFADLPSIAPHEIATIDQHFSEVRVPFEQVRDANLPARVRSSLIRIRRRAEAGMVPWEESLDWLHHPRLAPLSRTLPPAEQPFSLFVSRGCLGLCSYCGIRRAIGPVESKSIGDVAAELRQGLDDGHRIFNVLGDDPGCYGLDGSSSLPVLLGDLFDAADAYERSAASGTAPETAASEVRFRIREIHPKYLIAYHRDLLALPGFSRVDTILCPVQSGSDRVLGLMAREHTAGELLGALRRIRERSPGIRLDTQIIVGFPTETQVDFAATLDFVRDAGFDSVVVFPYDAKRGTPAAELQGTLPAPELKARVRAAFRYFRREGIDAYHSCP